VGTAGGCSHHLEVPLPRNRPSDPSGPSGPFIPGTPSSQPPPLEEPTDPAGPLPPKPDQQGPETRSPTGAETGTPSEAVAQQGEFLTTAHGARLRDSDHSLKAGARGPTLLQDHHLREKVSHFDHERIPERVVHARGAAAHGVFVANGAGEGICRAEFLKKGVETPVFVRFSTVLGSRGSPDLARDTRGFATRFYTSEGNYDLIGNNIPVFFIQDGIKFPDVIHAAKPHPDREIPQAQSAHDTFWDFVSLHTEAQAHTMWNMSDRGIPRAFRTMEGFGIHTFRLINAAGETSLVKFHWKPRLGVHSVTWEEAQLTNGVDPDFHRRDLADSIESGASPEWDFGVQVIPDNDEHIFRGIDLLDPTKFIPEELAPVQLLGTMTLNANPTNYFAETEQVAYNPANLVPGIDVTNDPLLQARLFSYLDTQLTRLSGPNWTQIPINRAHAPINDMLRDGFHQDAVHGGAAPYRPNSLDGGNPFQAGDSDHAFIDIPVEVPASQKVREHSASFDDHFSQVTLFYRSLTPVEQDHVVAAYTFELSKVLRADDPGATARRASQHRRRSGRAGSSRSRLGRAEAHRRGDRPRAERCTEPAGRNLAGDRARRRPDHRGRQQPSAHRCHGQSNAGGRCRFVGCRADRRHIRVLDGTTHLRQRLLDGVRRAGGHRRHAPGARRGPGARHQERCRRRTGGPVGPARREVVAGGMAPRQGDRVDG